jgi:tRNA 2-thiouridine synthesizing protein A
VSQWFGAGRHRGRHAAGPRGRAKPPVEAGRRPVAPADLASPPLSAPVAAEPRPAYPGTAIAAAVPPGAAPLVVIDALGRECPIPIIMLAEQIRDVPVGSVIAVLADDPAAYSDIPAWCSLKSHDCAFRVDLASGWSFGVRRHY